MPGDHSGGDEMGVRRDAVPLGRVLVMLLRSGGLHPTFWRFSGPRKRSALCGTQQLFSPTAECHPRKVAELREEQQFGIRLRHRTALEIRG